MLEHREVDLVIGGRPPGDGRFLTVATKANQLVVVAARGGHTEDGARQVSVEEMAAEVWLLREPGSGTRATTEELFEETGISPRTLTLGSNGAIRESVQAGLGITLLSWAAAARGLERGALEEWRAPGLPLRRAWHVVARAGEELPPTAGLFLAHLVAPGSGAAREPFTLVGGVRPPRR